jgi:hypothetical protein
VEYYHDERPHQSKDNLPLVRQRPETSQQEKKSGDRVLPEVDCRQRLGGLLKHYYRRAA